MYRVYLILLNIFHDQLFRFVVYRVQDADIARDITQETFLRIWEKRESLQPKKSFFSFFNHSIDALTS